jgi:hypothetical protein
MLNKIDILLIIIYKNSITKNRIYKMQKISSIILALFITLTFSNSAIAGHSE